MTDSPSIAEVLSARASGASLDRTPPETIATGLVFIMSGPSGVGKSTIIRHLKEDGFPIGYGVTATTRQQRPDELHGVHYYFLTEDEFDAWLASGRLLEHAVVHGRRYGIPIDGLRAALRQGHDVLIPPEVQGAATVRTKLANAIAIFLAPPTLDDLAPRLASRGSETPEERELRLRTAVREMEQLPRYDYVVVNAQGRVHDSVEQIKAIITAERCRIDKRLVTL
jgi:guanylate kinase